MSDIYLYTCIFESESHSVLSDSFWPHGIYNPWNSPGWNTGVGSLYSRGYSQCRDQIQVSCIASRFFTRWATGKLKNTGVGSLSLLQRIFLSQELNQGFLHCRQILYQLSYQGSPDIRVCVCVCVCILLKIFLKIIKSFSYFPLSVWIISCLLRKAIALE